MMARLKGEQHQLKELDETSTQKSQDERSIQLIIPERFNKSFHYFRYVIIIMGGLAMGTMLFLRLTITVAMISMVNRTAVYVMEHPNASESDLQEFLSEDYVETGEFVWTNEIQQIIMSGYMVAYTLPQFFTTRLTMRYGLRLGIPVSLAICSISNILTPVLSYWGWQYTLALRLFNGLGASAVLPSMVNAIECWLPYKDSAKGVALFQFMSNIIYAATPLISGMLTSFHWKWAFHVPGIIGLAFSFLWWIFAADNPNSSKFLSQKELDLINEVEIDDKTGKPKVNVKAKQRCDLPWYFMFKIKQFYALTIIWCLYCASIGGFLFLLPNYLKRVLKVPVDEIGRVNFYVQIGTMFCMLWPHPVANFLQSKFGVGLSAARSIIVFFCEIVVCCTFTYLAFFHDNLIVTICINRFFHMTNDTIVMATVMSMFGHAGVSGLVYSMVNTIGNLTTVVFCRTVGRFLDETGETLDCWSGVLLSMVAMNILYFFVYSAFCQSKPVEVSLPEEENPKDNVNPDSRA